MNLQRWSAPLTLALAALLAACRPAPTAPSPMSTPPPGQPTATSTPTLIPASPTPALPTSTPLPTWPDRWEPAGDRLADATIPLLLPHPTDPATVYAASDEGLYRSDDYGDSWDRLGDSPLQDLYINPGQPNTLYQVTAQARVLRSGDGGVTWDAPWPALRFSTVPLLVAAPSLTQTLYAHRAGHGLFRSDDGGATWQPLSNTGIDATTALAVHPGDPDFVLAGDTGGRVHRSRDGGDTWDLALKVPDATGITSLAFDPRVEPYFPRGKRPADPTRLYAASVGPRGTLWYSNDAGDTWKVLNPDLNFTNVRLLTVAPRRPGVVFAGVWGGGTWRSDDGGQTWRRVSGDPAFSPAAIVIDPTNTNTLYIADETTPRLYRSTDDAQTWETLFDAGPEYAHMSALALAPSDPRLLYVTAVRPDGSGTLFRVDTRAAIGENATDVSGDPSTGSGQSLPGPPSSLAVDRYDDGRLFATLPGAGLWRTVDAGATWRAVKSGLEGTDFTYVAIDPVQPHTLFLIGSGDPDQTHGIWKTTDDGTTWTRVGEQVLGQANGPIRAIAFHPDNDQVMYAAGRGGIYLSFDRGNTWANINGRLPLNEMNAVATDGQMLYAGSAGGGVFSGAIHPLIHTADWSPDSTLAVPVYDIQIALQADPQSLLVSAYPGGVFQTGDGGQAWQTRNLGLPAYPVADPPRQGHYRLSAVLSDTQRLYAGLYGRSVYRSDDGGATWQPAPTAPRIWALLSHPADPDVAYAATTEGVQRTVDGGQNWHPFDEGLPPDVEVRALALTADNRLLAGTAGYGLYARGAFVSQDDGWRPLPPLEDGVTPEVALFPAPDDPMTLFAAVDPGGILVTRDGVTWREQNTGLADSGALTLAFHPHEAQTLYAGTTDGLARSTDGGATWHPWDIGWPPLQPVTSIAVDPTAPHTLYACALTGRVMKSTDGGANWAEITVGLHSGLVPLQLLIDPFDPQILYLATAWDGVYISRNGGATWTTWNRGLRNMQAGRGDRPGRAMGFSADGRLLYFGTDGSGVWRRPAEGALSAQRQN